MSTYEIIKDTDSDVIHQGETWKRKLDFSSGGDNAESLIFQIVDKGTVVVEKEVTASGDSYYFTLSATETAALPKKRYNIRLFEVIGDDNYIIEGLPMFIRVGD